MTSRAKDFSSECLDFATASCVTLDKSFSPPLLQLSCVSRSPGESPSKAVCFSRSRQGTRYCIPDELPDAAQEPGSHVSPPAPTEKPAVQWERERRTYPSAHVRSVNRQGPGWVCEPRALGGLTLTLCPPLPSGDAGVTHACPGTIVTVPTYYSGAFRLPALAVLPAAGPTHQRGLRTWHSLLALPSWPAGGCLCEVSRGAVPGRASFCGPHLAAVRCSVSRSGRVLPAPRGAYHPGCVGGSHRAGRYPAQ